GGERPGAAQEPNGTARVPVPIAARRAPPQRGFPVGGRGWPSRSGTRRAHGATWDPPRPRGRPAGGAPRGRAWWARWGAAGEDVSLSTVAVYSELSLHLLEALDEDHWSADLPALRRHLERLHQRRAVRLLAGALDAAADDDGADLLAVVARVRELLAALLE